MTENTSTEATGTVAPSQDSNALPDWAREQISTANAQAAKYRNEKKDAVEAAKAEVENEWSVKYGELEASIAEKDTELSNQRLETDKLKAALEAGISSDKVLSFASLLKGENADELKSHAEEVKALMGDSDLPPANPPATDPTQGQGNHLPLNGDPLLEAVTRIVN